MKCLSESKALGELEKIKSAYRREIREKYEPKAKNCLTCEVQGICCLDEHFVNVQVTKLEAAAIFRHLQNFDEETRLALFERIRKTIEKYNLQEVENDFSQTFACPFFEQGAGCLIHTVKPVPCIQHACYEKREDLPPDEMQTNVEIKIERLNSQTYRQHFTQLPLPLWIDKLAAAK